MRLWMRLEIPEEEAAGLGRRHPEIDFVGGEAEVPGDLGGVEAI